MSSLDEQGGATAGVAAAALTPADEPRLPTSAGVRGTFVRAIDDWVRELDPARRKSTITISSFASITFMGLLGMVVAAYVPGPRAFFALDFWAALWWFVPPL